MKTNQIFKKFLKFPKLLNSILLLFFFMSCGGEAIPPNKKNYIGVWIGNGHVLTITEIGFVSSNKKIREKTKSVTGDIRSFDGDNFIIGPMFFTTTFNVEQPPHQREDGKIYMVVDGVLLEKNPDV